LKAILATEYPQVQQKVAKMQHPRKVANMLKMIGFRLEPLFRSLKVTVGNLLPLLHLRRKPAASGGAAGSALLSAALNIGTPVRSMVASRWD
jgi:hypothetical protein